jgi:hypothetical protein
LAEVTIDMHCQADDAVGQVRVMGAFGVHAVDPIRISAGSTGMVKKWFMGWEEGKYLTTDFHGLRAQIKKD